MNTQSTHHNGMRINPENIATDHSNKETTMNVKKLGRSLLKAGGYGLAFILSSLVVGGIVMLSANASLTKPAAHAFADPTLQPPVHDPHKPTVAVIASNEGTEITDFLAPYEVFAATEAFNVYAVAPKREFTPFLWGGLDIMPHYSFAELDQLLGAKPDVIVVPYIKNPENQEIVQWIRDHAGHNTLIVSICGGAHVLAATGLVDDGRVTTHQNYFRLLEKNYPHIQLVRGVRYTDNGNTITSAGITAGIDASLYTVMKLLGKDAALDVAAKLNYPHTQFLDAPAHQPPAVGAAAAVMGLNAGFLWNKQHIGVYLHEGVGEIDLTAILDSYGRTFTARTTTFAPVREVIRSRYGLYLVPRLSFATARNLDRIIVPGDTSAPVQSLAEWVEAGQLSAPEYLYPAEGMAASGGLPSRPFAFDSTITDLARQSSEADARSSANTLEYPIGHLQLEGRGWPLQRLASALSVGLLGVASVYMLERWWRARRRSLTPAL